MEYTEKSKPIILCAQQRSGTTLVQTALQSSQLCHNYGEVFHDKYLHFKKEHSFFNFKKKMISNNINFCFPSTDNQKIIFNKYFNFLKNQSKLPFHVIDIKYNSWHHFNPIWYSTETQPQLISSLKQHKFNVIHIVRKNLLHQYISATIAKKTGLYHFNKNDKNNYQDNKFVLNVPHCKRTINNVENNVNKYRFYFKNYSFYEEIYYEDLITENRFSDRINSVVSKFTNGLITDLGTPPLKKGIRDPFALVKNKDELFKNLKNTKFEVYL